MYVAVDKYMSTLPLQINKKRQAHLPDALIQVNKRIIIFLYQPHTRLPTHVFCPVPVTLEQQSTIIRY